MLTGITALELIPDALGRLDLVDHIRKLFKNAMALRASIAFWTLSPEQLNSISRGNGIRVLCERDSFLCVDIQNPTNIDHLANLVRLGIKVFLNIRKLPKAVEPLKISTSPGLLHTKFLLADIEDNQAALWIGSHNWTVPALIGPNTELSISLKLANRAPLYLEARYRLEDIRDNYCQPFDLNRIDYYKALQKLYERDTKSKNVVELEGYNVDDLAGQVICVFGTEIDDFSAVSSVNKKIFLSVYDSEGSEKYLYQAKVLQTGLLAAANPMADGLALSERRYAFTVGRSFPDLKPAEIPGPVVLDNAQFFANFEVLDFITSQYKLYDSAQGSKKPSRWTGSQWDPALERMNPEFVDIFYKKKVQLNNFIEVPSDDDRAVKNYKDEMLIEYSEIPIEQKRIFQDYRLISKRIIEY